jgi:para-nitrobenzyl esterase
MALRWVRANAERFGGDPDNVTVCGQSAGAILVGGLLADPEHRQLFRRAIIQSGSGSGAFSNEQAAVVAHAVTRRLGVGPTGRDLAEVADDALVEAVSQLGGLDLRTTTAFDPLGGITPFSLVLEEQPWSSVSRGGADVDLLIGSNTEEAALYLAPTGRLANVTRADVWAAAATFHPQPEALMDAYLRDLSGADDADLLTAVMGDGLFGSGTERLARAHAGSARGHTFRYEFAWRSGALGGQLGSAHTTELPFVFDCADRPELLGADSLLGRTAAPRALAESMHRAWVAFASSGDAGWPEYTAGSLLVQRIDAAWSGDPYARPEAFASWATVDHPSSGSARPAPE